MEKTVTYKSEFEIGDTVCTYWNENPIPYSKEACFDEYISCTRNNCDGYMVTGKIIKCNFYRDSFLYLVEFPTEEKLWVRECYAEKL